MTGNQMRELRRSAGLTQAMLAEQVGLSRKSVVEAEALGDGKVERRTEFAVRALTLAAAAREELLADSKRTWAEGDGDSAKLLEQAAVLLTGNFATDKQTIINLAMTAAKLRRQVERATV